MFYGVHRPKTGGTSIQYAFTNAYRENKIVRLGRASTKPSNKELLSLCLSENKEELFDLLEKTIYIGGHMNDSKVLWYMRNFDNLNTVLVIRDPISLFWSSYYQSLYGKSAGKEARTPEQFLKKRESSIAWHTNKYETVFGKESLNPSSKEFLFFFKYIIPTEKISESVPLIYEKTREWLKVPRRQMSKDPKKIRHKLQDDANFKAFLQEELAEDYLFFKSAQKLFNTQSYQNNRYSENMTKKVLSNFQANEPPSDYIRQLRLLIANTLDNNENSESNDKELALKIRQKTKKWEKALGDYGYSIETFKKLLYQT